MGVGGGEEVERGLDRPASIRPSAAYGGSGGGGLGGTPCHPRGRRSGVEAWRWPWWRRGRGAGANGGRPTRPSVAVGVPAAAQAWPRTLADPHPT